MLEETARRVQLSGEDGPFDYTAVRFEQTKAVASGVTHLSRADPPPEGDVLPEEDQAVAEVAAPTVEDPVDVAQEDFSVEFLDPADSQAAPSPQPVGGLIGGGGTMSMPMSSPTFSFSFTNSPVNEGEYAQFEVSASWDESEPVSVNWSTEYGTADAGVDYADVSGTIDDEADKPSASIRQESSEVLESNHSASFVVELSNECVDDVSVGLDVEDIDTTSDDYGVVRFRGGRRAHG